MSGLNSGLIKSRDRRIAFFFFFLSDVSLFVGLPW